MCSQRRFEGVSVSALVAQDSEEFFKLIDDNRKILEIHFDWIASCRSLDETTQILQTKLICSNKFPSLGFRLSGKLIGAILLSDFDAWNRSLDLGYFLAKEYTGNYLMTRALKLAIKHLFTDTELNRLTITTAANNLKSRRLAERCGFHQEAILAESWNDQGTLVSAHIYRLLRAEWLLQVKSD